MLIEFPSQEMEDRVRNVVFPAIVDGREIKCAISSAVLRDRFGMSDLYDPIPCFNANRQQIEQIAENLIEQGRFERDGTIMIKTTDI